MQIEVKKLEKYIDIYDILEYWWVKIILKIIRFYF